MSERVRHVFVYGTLRPGSVRWNLLVPFVVDEGWPDTVDGRLFDTGRGYPAAIVDARVEPGGTIAGRTFSLLDASVERCLGILDVEEGTVDGLYRRVVVTTCSGTSAWMWEYGDGLELTPVLGGDWLAGRDRSGSDSDR